MRGDSWSASLWTVPEHQCIPHPADYGPNFSPVRICKDLDPVTREVIAYHTEMGWMNPVRTIWMDGRPHPPEYAPHTWQGFSTGKWEGDVLTVTTTHLKPGYVRRNGLARSEKATLLEHFIRNGNVLTWISIVSDPVYLTEPYIKSRNFFYDPGYQMALYPCSVDIEVERPVGEIPHYLPGSNPYLDEFAMKWALPREAARGGAETMYPEYLEKMKGMTPLRKPAAPAPGRSEAMRRVVLATLVSVAGFGASTVVGQSTSDALHAWPIRENVFMLVGPGANTTVHIGRDGVLVVDPQMSDGSALLAAIRRLSDKPIRFIVDTTIDADHISGNEALAKSGQVLAGGNTRPATVAGTGGAPIFAHENLLNRLSESGASTSEPAHRHLLHQAERHVRQRRGRATAARARRAHGRRHNCVLPAQRRHQCRRCVHTRSLPDDRPRARRQHRGDAGGDQLHPRARGARHQRRGRDDDRPRSWPPVRRVGRQRLSRHGDYRARSRGGHGEEEDDARTGEGGEGDS